MPFSENDLPEKLPLDEASLFTLEEFEKAALFIMPPDQAREWASTAHEPNPNPEARKQKSTISPDLLDVLSIVSESCAASVEMIWQLAPKDAKARRDEIAQRYGLAR